MPIFQTLYVASDGTLDVKPKPPIPEKETVYAVPTKYLIYHQGRPYHARLFDTEEQVRVYMQDRFNARDQSILQIARATWQDREWSNESNSVERDLTLPVWNAQGWWLRSHHVWNAHHARVSRSDPTMLAYFPDPNKACLGIRTKIKAGRYLAKFYPDMPEAERARMAKWQETGTLPTEYSDTNKYPLHFTSARATIRKVYETGPASCMSGLAKVYTKHFPERIGIIHPCEAYAGPDLALAYITDQQGRPRARAIVWPDKKKFGRVYPSCDNYHADGFKSGPDAEAMQHELRNRLRALGYSNPASAFEGARMSRIRLSPAMSSTSSQEVVSFPYLDGGYGFREDDAEPDKYFVLGAMGKYPGSSTNGAVLVSKLPLLKTCDKCARQVDEEGLADFHDTISPIGLAADPPRRVCQRCADRNGFFCQGIAAYVSRDIDSVSDDIYCYNRAWAQANLLRSARSGQLILGRAVNLHNGDLWSASEIEEHAFYCRINSAYYPKAELSPLFSGGIAIWTGCTDEQIVHYIEGQESYRSGFAKMYCAEWLKAKGLSLAAARTKPRAQYPIYNQTEAPITWQVVPYPPSTGTI